MVRELFASCLPACGQAPLALSRRRAPNLQPMRSPVRPTVSCCLWPACTCFLLSGDVPSGMHSVYMLPPAAPACPQTEQFAGWRNGTSPDTSKYGRLQPYQASGPDAGVFGAHQWCTAAGCCTTPLALPATQAALRCLPPKLPGAACHPGAAAGLPPHCCVWVHLPGRGSHAAQGAPRLDGTRRVSRGHARLAGACGVRHA